MRLFEKMKAAALALAAVVWSGPGPAAAQDLTIWALPAFNQAGDRAAQEMAAAFGRERSIRVDYVIVPANVINQRLAASFEAGSPPDVFMQVGQQAQFYIGRNLVQPIPEVLERMRRQPGGIYENLVSQGLRGDIAYSVPLEVDIVPMFARTDLLKAVGSDVPQTWAALREAAQKILQRDRALGVFGLPISPANDAETMLRMIVWSHGGEMFAADGRSITWNSPETVAAYQFVADMFAEGTIPRSVLSWDDSSNNTAYQTGRTAFTMNPPSIYQWLVENDKAMLANTALASVPKGPGAKGRNGNSVSSFNWFVSARARQPDHAKAWLDYFFEPTRYGQLITAIGGRWVPIYPSLVANLPLFKDAPIFANVDLMARTGIIDGHAGPPSAAAGEIYTAKIVGTSFQKMVVDRMPAAQAVAWAQSEMEKVLAANR